jgi:hypothetical protein
MRFMGGARPFGNVYRAFSCPPQFAISTQAIPRGARATAGKAEEVTKKCHRRADDPSTGGCAQ